MPICWVSERVHSYHEIAMCYSIFTTHWVSLRLVDSRYWAEVTNFGHKFVHVPENYVRDYDRLLTGGIWAQVDMTWDDTDEKAPFFISKLTPIQNMSVVMNWK